MSKASGKRKAAARTKQVAEIVEDSILGETRVRWRVARGGYEWDGDVLRAKGPGNGVDVRVYNPLKDAGSLFMSFGRLSGSRDEFRAFADQFGLLKVGLEEEQPWIPKPDEQSEQGDEWRDAHHKMRLALLLWDCLSKGTVAECVRGGSGPWTSFETLPSRTPWNLYEPGKDGKWLMSFVSKGNDPQEATTQRLRGWINGGLEGNTKLRVLWHPERGKHVLRVLPHTLLGCMWWQFARVLTGELMIAECRVCGRPMEIGPEALRATRVFCSQGCKQKDHRSRVRQAKELKGKKWSVVRIAKKLDTTPEVIERWLTKLK